MAKKFYIAEYDGNIRGITVEKRRVGGKMIRTDLALEACSEIPNSDGVNHINEEIAGVTVTRTEIVTEEAEKRIGKPRGRYITVDVGDIALGVSDTDNIERVIASEIKGLISSAENALVIGVGNTDITPDALGPKTADGVLATRHLLGRFAKEAGLKDLKSVSVLSPGVLGRTGMESAEVIRAVCGAVKPDTIIAVDALAAADMNRLGTTVQINDVGISPGSGVGNRRKELTKNTLGTRVIAIGVPTVTDSSVFGGEGGFIVTPREIDLLISRASELLSHAINFALQPGMDREILLSLV